MAKRKQYLAPDPDVDPVGAAEAEEFGDVVEAEEVVEEEPKKPWVGPRDPKAILSAEDAAAIDAHEDRVHLYNLTHRAMGLPEALTKEEQDQIP